MFREPTKPYGITGALLTLASTAAERVEPLRPEVFPSSSRILDSILQFDLVTCVIVVIALESRDTGNWYPSLGFWPSWRHEPIVVRLISDLEMRSEIFGHQAADEVLRNALWTIAGIARERGQAHLDWESKVAVDFFAPVRAQLGMR
jgi:hypothetical protein